MKALTLIAAAGLVLTGCSDNTAPQPQAQVQSQPALMQPQAPAQQPALAAPQPQQVIVQQAPAQQNNSHDMLMGGMLGYMLGGAGNRSAVSSPAIAPAPAPTVIHKTIVNKTVIQQVPPKVEPIKQVAPPTPPAPPARVVPAPAPSSYKPATTTYVGSGASSYRRK